MPEQGNVYFSLSIIENWGYCAVSNDPNKYELYSHLANIKFTASYEFLLSCKNKVKIIIHDRRTNRDRELNDNEKIRLLGYITKQNLYGSTPSIEDFLKDIEKLPPIPNIRERAYLLLEWFVKKSDPIGKGFCFFSSEMRISEWDNEHSLGKDNFVFCLALCYSKTVEEMKFLLKYLKEMEFISNLDSFQVTVKGFEKINTVSNINSKTAFIAMWITSQNKTIEKLYDCIHRAVRQAGYEPSRIDEKDHIKKIDDEILVEINKARFAICDLTSETGKPRGSVYFEAGYALGKNIDIIWTCDKSLAKELPFDIRQYNCLFWDESNMEDFTNKLQKRIENVIR